MMPNTERNTRCDGMEKADEATKTELAGSEDMLMEQILENLNSTPVGKVLKQIASLPEVRMDKVLSMRSMLSEGQYDVNARLDSALDRVLEDLTA